MTDLLETMQAACQQDIWRMHRRAEALERFGDAARAIRALGYDVEVTAPGGMLELRFDSEQAIAPAQGPLAAGRDAVDPADGGAVQPTGKAVATPPPPKPAPVRRAAPETDRDALRTGPFSEEEKQVIVARVAAGAAPGAIAADLRRTVGAVNVMTRQLLDRIVQAKAAQDPGAEPDPGRAEAGAEPADAPPPDPQGAPSPDLVNYAKASDDDMPEGLSVAERAIWRHLSGLPASFWTPKRDLALAEGLARGDGAARVCEALGVDRADLRARWAQLNTRWGDLDHQQALLRVLRLRAELC